ncbi:hypothetical protein ACFQH8_02710 [Halomicroarcula sp. GCM10025710]
MAAGEAKAVTGRHRSIEVANGRREPVGVGRRPRTGRSRSANSAFSETVTAMAAASNATSIAARSRVSPRPRRGSREPRRYARTVAVPTNQRSPSCVTSANATTTSAGRSERRSVTPTARLIRANRGPGRRPDWGRRRR